MSQQYNSLMELYINFYKILLFMKMSLPSSFILRYMLGPPRWMCMHLWMTLKSIRTIDIQEKEQFVKIYVDQSMESCPLVISHTSVQSLHREAATYTYFALSLLFNGLSKSAQTFTVGFVKLPSIHSIHICLFGETSPFKGSMIT